MVIEEALIAYLLTQTGLTALISDRIYPNKLPQTPKLPAIVYQKIDAPRISGFTADIGVMSRIQTTSWASTYTGASAVQEQIRAATQNYMNQTMGGTGGVEVKNIDFDEGPDSYEDETERYEKIIDLLIWHTEA
jgi:hypothetical protein